jgi:hypothetical protein
VVVEDDLTVEPGPSFRNDGTDSDYSSGDTDPPYVTGALYDGLDTDGLGDLIDDPDDLPAMYVSDDTNGGIRIELAVPNRHSKNETDLNDGETHNAGDPFKGTFSDVLQVTNDGTEELEFGIKFSTFGDMVTDSNPGDGEIQTENVYKDIFTFEGPEHTISSKGYDESPSDPADQNVKNDTGATVGVGDTVSVDLTVNLDGYATAIREAATPGTSAVFNDGSSGTVQLVRELQFGTLNSSEAF